MYVTKYMFCVLTSMEIQVQLRDAIVYGYHLRAARTEREGQHDLQIPLWYTRGLSPLEQRDSELSRDEIPHSVEERIHGFRLLEVVVMIGARDLFISHQFSLFSLCTRQLIIT